MYNQRATTPTTMQARDNDPWACSAPSTSPLPPLSSAIDFAGSDNASGIHLVSGPLRFCHYGADGFNDAGWGCGYRTVQTILSWCEPAASPPSIPEMQDVIGNAVGSTAWIGVPECVILLDVLHGATTEVLPLASGSEIAGHLPRLAAHFDNGGGPAMVGGGGDVYSKTLIGVRQHEGGGGELLILDPHFEGTAAHTGDMELLRTQGRASWKPLTVLSAASFYNLALPRPLSSPSHTSSAARAASLGESRLPNAWSTGGQPAAATEWAIEVVGSSAAVAEWAIEVVGSGCSSASSKQR